MRAPNEIRISGNVVWMKLTRGKWALFDLSDLPLLAAYRWGAQKSTRDSTWYVVATDRSGARKKGLLMHRLLLPESAKVDHRNWDGLDNRRGNLRPCDNSQSVCRRRKFRKAAYTSRFKGVYWRADFCKWRAFLYHHKKRFHLGYFDSEEPAARAYDRKARELHGPFACLNFPA